MKTRQEKIFDQLPSLVGEIAGWKFYEHPIYGDAEPLMAITPEGNFLEWTDWDEVPTQQDIEEYYEQHKLY